MGAVISGPGDVVGSIRFFRAESTVDENGDENGGRLDPS